MNTNRRRTHTWSQTFCLPTKATRYLQTLRSPPVSFPPDPSPAPRASIDRRLAGTCLRTRRRHQNRGGPRRPPARRRGWELILDARIGSFSSIYNLRARRGALLGAAAHWSFTGFGGERAIGREDSTTAFKRPCDFNFSPRLLSIRHLSSIWTASATRVLVFSPSAGK